MLSLSHEQTCASLLNPLPPTVPMVNLTTVADADSACRPRLKQGLLYPSLSGKSPGLLLSTEVEDEIQHQCDGSVSLC